MRHEAVRSPMWGVMRVEGKKARVLSRHASKIEAEMTAQRMKLRGQRDIEVRKLKEVRSGETPT